MRLLLMSVGLFLSTTTLVTSSTVQETDGQPIIDMHLHAFWLKPGAVESLTGLQAPETPEELQRQTLAIMEESNVILGVISGDLTEGYIRAAPETVLPGLPDFFNRGLTASVQSLRDLHADGRLAVFAEFAPQYAGIPPADDQLAPYFALAEELDIPVGIHMGLGPPGAAYSGFPNYRMTLSNPLLLEDVLLRHPKLRLYVMHAGWPMLDEMVGLLHAHPQVYLDIAVINWVLPRAEFHSYLRRLVEAGFADRIMFGSDQMVWPEAIPRAIDAVTTAPFLSREEKRAIFCGNAAKFLQLEEAVCE